MRAIWKGSISFALVSIPISVFSATRRNELSFHYLHKKEMSPVSYKRFCDGEDVEVPWEEITRGYEYEKGQYVEITDEDLEKAMDLGYTMALGRPCSASEKQMLLSYLREYKDANPSPAAAEKLAWFLINLDEFVFVR